MSRHRAELVIGGGHHCGPGSGGRHRGDRLRRFREDRPDLNDQTGVVVLIRPDKRLTVIVGSGEIIAVRPVKLALVPGASKVAVLT